MGLGENRGSSAALASPQRLFLLEEWSTVFLERGESMLRVVCIYDPYLEWNQLCKWKPWKGRSLDSAPILCGREPPSPAGARQKSEHHLHVGTGQTNMLIKNQARKR